MSLAHIFGSRSNYKSSQRSSAQQANTTNNEEDKNFAVVKALAMLPCNKDCFDCSQKGTTYTNLTIGSFVCTSCSGKLRGLNPPHRLKSISMGTFSDSEVEFLKARGNEYSKRVWMAKYPGILLKCINKEHLCDLMTSRYEKKTWYVEGNSTMMEEIKRNNDLALEKTTKKSSLHTSCSSSSSSSTCPTLRPTHSIVTEKNFININNNNNANNNITNNSFNINNTNSSTSKLNESHFTGSITSNNTNSNSISSSSGVSKSISVGSNAFSIDFSTPFTDSFTPFPTTFSSSVLSYSSIHPSTHSSINPSAHSSTHQPVHPSTHLFIHTSIQPSPSSNQSKSSFSFPHSFADFADFKNFSLSFSPPSHFSIHSSINPSIPPLDNTSVLPPISSNYPANLSGFSSTNPFFSNTSTIQQQQNLSQQLLFLQQQQQYLQQQLLLQQQKTLQLLPQQPLQHNRLEQLNHLQQQQHNFWNPFNIYSAQQLQNNPFLS